PSYLLLGSLDAARYQMAAEGKALMSRALELANHARQKIEQLPKLKVLNSDDYTRLTVDISRLGITGFDADEILHTKHGVTCELPTLRTLTFIISLGNIPADIHQLIQGLTQLAKSHHSTQPTLSAPLPFSRSPIHHSSLLTSPRQTFFAPKHPLPLKRAIGKTCAETITPYPPGIPLLLPGETITERAIAHLQTLKAAGSPITGPADPTLQTLLTLAT
ncbi:MAG: arginine decarboxylase, partial [Cyanobacteria bacterium P01_D01_bin.6]